MYYIPFPYFAYNYIINNIKKLNKEGKEFKCRNRIPRAVRLNLRRKQEASKALSMVKSASRCRTLKNKIKAAEEELSKTFFKYKIDKEKKAIECMKDNSKYFFSYVKQKTNDKGKIGPFTDSKGNIIKIGLQDIRPQKETIIRTYE